MITDMIMTIRMTMEMAIPTRTITIIRTITNIRTTMIIRTITTMIIRTVTITIIRMDSAWGITTITMKSIWPGPGRLLSWASCSMFLL